MLKFIHCVLPSFSGDDVDMHSVGPGKKKFLLYVVVTLKQNWPSLLKPLVRKGLFFAKTMQAREASSS